MKRVNFFLPEPLLESYRRLAAARGTPMAELIRSALEAYLKGKDAVPSRTEHPHS
jgi:predicted DNA binding CopG/RHH family protein